MLKINLQGDPKIFFRDGKLPKLTGVSVVTPDPYWTHPMHAHHDTSDIVLVTQGRASCIAEKINM